MVLTHKVLRRAGDVYLLSVWLAVVTYVQLIARVLCSVVVWCCILWGGGGGGWGGGGGVGCFFFFQAEDGIRDTEL